MKEVIFCTDGDSNDINTWSNVPYFFSYALENKGILVHRINIEVKGIVLLICKISSRIKRIRNDLSLYGIKDTKWFRRFIKLKLYNAEKKYPQSDCIFMLDYRTVLPKFGEIKTIVFGDWPTAYYIYNHLGRKPDRKEYKTIRMEKEAIVNADYAITMFPNAYFYIKKQYPGANLYYLGNVINSNEMIDNIDNKIKLHINSNSMLFIGRKNYINAAINLIKTVNYYNRIFFADLHVNIIGLTKDDFDESMDLTNVSCYGFLRKDNAHDKKMYYKLISECRAIINTTEKWGGASSLIEAMYYGCPVIVSPFKDFVEMFGEHINFGFYCEKNTIEMLSKIIDIICNISPSEYKNMCINAHEAVKGCTWDVYTEKVISLIEGKF